MFGWEFPPLHSGGLGVACRGLVRGLTQNGVRVTLVLPRDAGVSETDVSFLHPTAEQCALLHVPSGIRPYDTEQSYRTRMAGGGSALLDELYGPDLGEAVERFEELSVELTKNVSADVIHCHDWMTFGAGARAAAHHRKPLVAHVHATEFDRTNFQPNPWIADRERRGLMAADRIIAVSRYTKNLLIRHYGIPADRIAVVHNAHDTQCLPRCELAVPSIRRDPLVLFLGRLTVQKNPVQFLEVAKRVRESRPDARFVMAGDGPLFGELVERACAMGLQEHVLFAGKVTEAEAHSLFADAACFVMPSVSEPFGLVALEAVAHGVPVVLSKQSGACEVIEHGFAVDFWDTERMADCIVTILRETPLARQLRSEAPRILQKLTWSSQAERVRSIYDNLITS